MDVKHGLLTAKDINFLRVFERKMMRRRTILFAQMGGTRKDGWTVSGNDSGPCRSETGGRKRRTEMCRVG